MICQVCTRMLRAHSGKQWRGTVILSEVKKLGRILGDADDALPGERKVLTCAGISPISGWSDTFRLDFKLYNSDTRLGTFILIRSDKLKPPTRTPIHQNTKSEEVFQLAKRWLSTCRETHNRCKKTDNKDNLHTDPKFTPKRLVDLHGLKDKGPKKEIKVKVILTEEWGERQEHNCDYITLSHRWGGHIGVRLQDSNKAQYESEGIDFDELPKTFRDAMELTTMLGLSYIWIDSLCIIQHNREDWLSQSILMDKIYGSAYCNISATASKDSHGGLFFNRNPENLWEDDVYLSTSSVSDDANPATTQRCTVIDPTFWDRQVDSAPVNTRGWVLQERLIAPRVLHFCRDQIAWECSELQAAECHPDGLPDFQVVSGSIVQRRKVKGLDPDIDGRKLREARKDLHSSTKNRQLLSLSHYLANDLGFAVQFHEMDRRVSILDVDRNLIPEIYAYELWKHVVEQYSSMDLTRESDKLIAFSGIAQVMARRIDRQYIAGMWREHLESQLLWYVNDQFQDGRFKYASRRSHDYRAPSFSWAAIDSPSGITYGEITDRDLLISISKVEVIPEEDNDYFGLLKAGLLTLKANNLREVQMEIIASNDTIRFGWRFMEDVLYQEIEKEGMAGRGVKRPYSNVYLDSPVDDDDILNTTRQIFCLPAASSDDYLLCLLLKLLEPQEVSAFEQELASFDQKLPSFKRIGLAKVAPYDKVIQTRLKEQPERLDKKIDRAPARVLSRLREGLEQEKGYKIQIF
ncbi:MAG: hypothetical protein Q9157_002993 [Trypethelium eluteriae]